MTIRFRFATSSDAPALQAIYAPYCDSSYESFETHAPTVAQMAERISRISAQYPWLVCDIAGQPAGYVYASPHGERAAYGWSVDVAVYTSPAHRRRGVARGLYSSLFALLRAQGYFKAYAGIVLPNEPSMRLHEAVGFKPVAVFRGIGFKLGQWRDVGWWERGIQPEVADPPPPQAIGEILNTGSVQDALAKGAQLVRTPPGL
jgi:L-amino acid N-acyltransferase YncA